MSSKVRLENIAAAVHGRYLVHPASHDSGRRLLVGFHGYGESAEAHLAELERIPDVAAWTVVAVQALHPFYNSRTGEVVASWMTRLDRQLAIQDNVRYVAEVVRREIGEAGPLGTLVYIGFSQGTAMAYRAAAAAGHPCRGVVALAGDIPPELADPAARLPPVMIGRGRDDEWYTEEKLDRDLQVLAAKGIEPRLLRFAGGHEWTDAFRQGVASFLTDLRANGTD